MLGYIVEIKNKKTDCNSSITFIEQISIVIIVEPKDCGSWFLTNGKRMTDLRNKVA